MKSFTSLAALGLALLASSGLASAAIKSGAVIAAPGPSNGAKPLVKIPGHRSNLIAQTKIKSLMASGVLKATKGKGGKSTAMNTPPTQ